jgi:hypothetical protein
MKCFRTVVDSDGLGFSFHVHGQEFSSFTRSKTLRDFQLRPREKFLYSCGAIDLWNWECRLLDQQAGANGDAAPLCVAGRGATPPGHCGGPAAYRLLLKRQKEGESMCAPAQVESVIGMLAAADPDQPLQQAAEDLQRRRQCPSCGGRYQSKEAGMHTVNTVFGPVAVPNPRWHRCACQTEGPKTFRPTAAWLRGRTISGNQMGFIDSFREGGRFIERSIAGRRIDQSRDRP